MYTGEGHEVVTETKQRVGPYMVVRELARAAGAIFAEAEDADGERCLLQMLPLATSAHPNAESEVARLTTELVQDVAIHAHGAADGAKEGERIFYWALPWVDLSESDAAKAAAKEDMARVHRIARRLAEWLAARHRRGRTHVLLSHSVVSIDDKNLVSVVGVPIAVANEALADEVEGAPWAPEEREARRATLSGDLWRLGAVIRHLAGDGATMPAVLRELIEELTAEAPDQRPRSAETVVRRLIDGRRVMDTSVRRPPSPRRSHRPSPTTAVGPAATKAPATSPSAPLTNGHDSDLEPSEHASTGPTTANSSPPIAAASGSGSANGMNGTANGEARTALRAVGRTERPFFGARRTLRLSPDQSKVATQRVRAPAETKGEADAAVPVSARDVDAESVGGSEAAAPGVFADDTPAGDDQLTTPSEGLTPISPDLAKATESDPDPTEPGPAEATGGPAAAGADEPAPRAVTAVPSLTPPAFDKTATVEAEASPELLAQKAKSLAETEVSAKKPTSRTTPVSEKTPTSGQTPASEDTSASEAAVSPRIAGVAGQASDSATGAASSPGSSARSSAEAAEIHRDKLSRRRGRAQVGEPVTRIGAAPAGPNESAESSTGSQDLPPADRSIRGAGDSPTLAGHSMLRAARSGASTHGPHEGHAAASVQADGLESGSGFELAGAADEPFEAQTDLDPIALLEDLPELPASEIVSVDGEVLDAIVSPVEEVSGSVSDVDVSGVDVSGVDVSGVDVSGVDVSGVDVDGEGPMSGPLKAFGGTADLPADVDEGASSAKALPKAPVASSAAIRGRNDHESFAPDVRVSRANLAPGPALSNSTNASNQRVERTEPIRPVQRTPATPASTPSKSRPGPRDELLFDPALRKRENFPSHQRGPVPITLSSPQSRRRLAYTLRRRAGTWPIVLAILAVFLVVGYFAARDPSPTTLPPATTAVEVRADHWLRLSSAPIGAEVIAEDDGRLLGKTPMAIMVPADTPPMAVLVYAVGRVPMRVALPDNGALSVVLPPVPQSSCMVPVSTSSDVVLEEHRGSQVIPGMVSVAGAAIFRRFGEGPVSGARIVACPATGTNEPVELSFSPAQSRRLRVSAPTGVTVQLEGRMLESLPAEVHTEHAFVEMRVEDPQGRRLVRWVGLGDDTDVRLPAPSTVEGRTQPVSADMQVTTVTNAAAGPPKKTGSSRSRIRRGKKSASRYLRRAKRALAAGRSKDARNAYRRCLKIDRDYAACHRGLGVAYQRLDQPERAAVHFRRYLELRPEASDAPRVRRLLDETLRL